MKLEQYYKLFQDRQLERIRDRWKELSGIIGKQVKIEDFDRAYEGRSSTSTGTIPILKASDGHLERLWRMSCTGKSGTDAPLRLLAGPSGHPDRADFLFFTDSS